MKWCLVLARFFLRRKLLVAIAVLIICILSASHCGRKGRLAESPWAKGKVGAKVLSVIDGDTVKCRLHNGTGSSSVRLLGIDAPEKGQAFGRQSANALSYMVDGRDVVVNVTGVDRYGRQTGTLYLGGTDVCLAMVQQGWAWHYAHYLKSEQYAEAAAEAKSQRLGLWKQEVLEAPWDWRAQKRVKPGSRLFPQWKAWTGVALAVVLICLVLALVKGRRRT
jgi:endonuclease YncB( thermonuclease family)